MPSVSQCRAGLAAMSMLLRMGFTREFSYHLPCELLPHISTLTAKRRRLFSVALSLESPPPVVSRHSCSAEPGLSSRALCARDRLTYSLFIILHFSRFVKSVFKNVPRRHAERPACEQKDIYSARDVFVADNPYPVHQCAYRDEQHDHKNKPRSHFLSLLTTRPVRRTEKLTVTSICAFLYFSCHL